MRTAKYRKHQTILASWVAVFENSYRAGKNESGTGTERRRDGERERERLSSSCSILTL